MKKLIDKVTIAALSLLPAAALAQEEGPVKEVPGLIPITAPGRTLGEAIIAIINAILIVAGALAVLFLVIGGIRYIISSGQEDQIKAARATIFNAVIGIVVILLSLVIVNTLTKFIGGS